ncbi:MAG: cation transporter [Burkholderiaceae bacterium]
MSAHHDHTHKHSHDHGSPEAAKHPKYRKILWFALIVNAAMFAIELGAGFSSGSVSLLADAIDFLGDAANYGVSLAVLTMAMAWRSKAALLKGVCMLGFGVFVLARAIWVAKTGAVPEAATMGSIGLLALIANVTVALLLYRYRTGDANMRSVWLCSRNDAFGNIAVMLAALGVFGTGSAWPDLAVAIGMASLAIWGGWSVIQHARLELSKV